MIALVTVPELRSRLGLGPEVLGVDPALESALTAAHLRLQALLDTEFDPRLRMDVFHLDPGLNAGICPGGTFRLRLRAGFIRGEVTIDTALSAFRDTGNPHAYTGECHLDPVRGFLSVPEHLRGQFLHVSYASGFESSGDAPDWLREAILAYAPSVLSYSQPGHNKNDVSSLKHLADHALAVASPYVRTKGFTYSPVN